MKNLVPMIDMKRSSEKSFGVVFAVVFFLIGLYPLLEEGVLHLWALTLSLLFIILTCLAPNTLVLPNKLWFKLGMVLGAVVAPIVMGLVYFTTVVPIGLIMRLMGKDLLRQKFNKNVQSYWIERNQPLGSMRDQF